MDSIDNIRTAEQLHNYLSDLSARGYNLSLVGLRFIPSDSLITYDCGADARMKDDGQDEFIEFELLST